MLKQAKKAWKRDCVDDKEMNDKSNLQLGAQWNFTADGARSGMGWGVQPVMDAPHDFPRATREKKAKAYLACYILCVSANAPAPTVVVKSSG